MQLIIREIDFDLIDRVWRDFLWPGRVSAIEPYSAMMFMHDRYEGEFSTQPQIFLGGFIDPSSDLPVAVNSLHLAEKYMARSRGLWVAPKLRGMGFGQQILEATSNKATALGADAIWSFSRKSSIRSYERAGYIRTSSWMDHGEFGPNAYVICPLYK